MLSEEEIGTITRTHSRLDLGEHVNVVWEFKVRGGFKPFDAVCQGSVESQHQAFKAGDGPAVATVVSGSGFTILIDFETMRQHLKGSQRERAVQRRVLPASAPATESPPEAAEKRVSVGEAGTVSQIMVRLERQESDGADDVLWEVNPSGQPFCGEWEQLDDLLCVSIEEQFQRFMAGAGCRETISGRALDFKLLSLEAEEECFTNEVPATIAGPPALQKPLRPIRRWQAGQVTNPLPGSLHPWYEWRVNRIEALGGAEDWLTNDFFIRAFRMAIAQDGEELSTEAARQIFNFQYNQDFRNRSPTLERRGGVLYRVPHGWKRFALNVKGKYPDGDAWMSMEGKPGEWAIAYHGTKMNVVPKIIEGGFKMGPNQHAIHKDMSDSRTGQKIGSGVYCTPNITVVECYANGEEVRTGYPPVTVDGHTLLFAFQCRVRPGAICRPKWPYGVHVTNDEEVMGIDGVFEWVVNHPMDIRPYAVLVRDREGLRSKRTLHDIAVGMIHGNKPLPQGTHASIAGGLDKEAQLAAEEEQIKAMGPDRAKKAELALKEVKEMARQQRAQKHGAQQQTCCTIL